MKTVFDNSMVAHVWAQRVQPYGRSNNGNFYFDGGKLHSYGSHFIVAMHHDDSTVLMNQQNYSISTSKHKNEAWSATTHKTRVYVPDLTVFAESFIDRLPYIKRSSERFDFLKNVAVSNKYDENQRDLLELYVTEKQATEIIEKSAQVIARKLADGQKALDKMNRDLANDIRKNIKTYLERVAKSHNVFDLDCEKIRIYKAHKYAKNNMAESTTRKVWDLLKAVRERIKFINRFADVMLRNRHLKDRIAEWRTVEKLETWKQIDSRISVGDVLCHRGKIPESVKEKIRNECKLLVTQRDRLMEIENAEIERQNAELITQWRNGESVQFPNSWRLPTECRIKGETLQTSQRADVPLRHAIVLFLKAAKCKRDETEWRRNGQQIRVGHFSTDRIETNGTIHVGCHEITFAKMMECALRDLPEIAKQAEGILNDG